MLSRIDLRGASLDGLRTRLPRPRAATEPPSETVASILAAVRDEGDAAVRRFTKEFDHVELEELRVPDSELQAALASIVPLLREALEAARANIVSYHRSQLREDTRHESDGIVLRELFRPVERVGVYVPSALAPLISTVLMTALPARVAGVGEVVLCTAPGPDGKVAEGILAAAALANVDEVYAVGGAQAIGALAYGTESIRPVDVIVGPGNIYVSEAKRQVASSGLVGVPSSFPGPSEVVVVADETTPPDLAAIDLIVQIEHGPDGLAWLITWSEDAAAAIQSAMAGLVADAPRREVIEANLATNCYLALVDGPEAAIEVANAVAPEHLQLMSADPESLLPMVKHAGAVFCGAFAPASVGDYIAGPSHVLPTYGSARFASALRVDDFIRAIHVVALDEAALNRVAPHVAALAEAEGLAAHALSVRMRSNR
ncbi:MAG TPA: histidinol dehydrogenase [Acidimicrobiales bacterium]|nr:histidinol dehydrogenase [Acidimicrobiales bacterium]